MPDYGYSRMIVGYEDKTLEPGTVYIPGTEAGYIPKYYFFLSSENRVMREYLEKHLLARLLLNLKWKIKSIFDIIKKALLYIICCILFMMLLNAICLVIDFINQNSIKKPTLDTVSEIEESTDLVSIASFNDSTWHEVTDRFDLKQENVLYYGDYKLTKFNSKSCIGVDIGSNSVIDDIADYGFTISIFDSDVVYLEFYNNTSDSIYPVELSVEQWDSNYYDTDVADMVDYVLSGYSEGSNGFGLVTMTFSTGNYLTMGIYKEDDQLYAFNIDLAE